MTAPRPVLAGRRGEPVPADTSPVVDGLPVGSVEDLLALLGREVVHPAPAGSAGLRLGLWRAQWQQVSGRRLPAVVRPTDGVVVTGAEALAYLSGLLTGAAADPTSPHVFPS